jgi:hypothetical protein
VNYSYDDGEGVKLKVNPIHSIDFITIQTDLNDYRLVMGLFRSSSYVLRELNKSMKTLIRKRRKFYLYLRISDI